MANDLAYQSWFRQWAADMGSDAAGSGKIPTGPVETLAAKPGHKIPMRKRGGSRVPPPSAGQQKKL